MSSPAEWPRRSPSPAPGPSLLRPHLGARRIGPASVLAVVLVGTALAAAHVGALLPALPEIRAEVGGASGLLTLWLITAYPLGVLVALPAGNLLARRLGRRRLYVGGALLFALAAVVAGVVETAAPFVGARLVQGVGAGILLPAAVGLVTTARPRPARGWWPLSLWGVALVVFLLLGPPVGEAAARLGGWRAVLWGSAALGVLAAAVAVRSLVEQRDLRMPGRTPRTTPAQGTASRSPRGADTSFGRDQKASDPTGSLHSGHGPPHEQPLYFQLPEDSRRRLATGNPRHIAAGDWIVREGEPASAMFVILSGRAEVLVGDDPVRELGPGSVVGELALLTGRPRSASVRARRDCEVIEVSRHAWDSAVLTDPAAVSLLVRGMAAQLADTAPTRPLPSPRPAVIGVVWGTDHPTGAGPGATAGSPARILVTDVASTLHDLLGRHGTVTSLARSEPSALEAAERENDWVLLCSDGSDARWHDYVLRQCDRLVLVTEATRQACVLPRPAAHRPELVLVGDRPASAVFSAWAECIDPHRVTVVRRDRLADDLRALGDRLAGRSIGLVLSGGGARAMSHIGVLLELEEADIAVDRVAGSSLGAIVGAVYAAGAGAPELAERAYSALVRGRPFSDYTLPGKALTRGRRHLRLLQEHLGDLVIEELPRGFQCVSADLRTRRLWVHTRGSIALAAAASSRIPVLFPPIVDGPRLLVDGGVLDNLPVQLLADRDEGPVIAVNVLPDDLDAAARAAGPAVVPSVTETLLRTVEINADEEDRAFFAGAHVVTPRTLGVGVLEFHHFDAMVESGRQAARELLEATGGDLHSPPTR